MTPLGTTACNLARKGPVWLVSGMRLSASMLRAVVRTSRYTVQKLFFGALTHLVGETTAVSMASMASVVTITTKAALAFAVLIRKTTLSRNVLLYATVLLLMMRSAPLAAAKLTAFWLHEVLALMEDPNLSRDVLSCLVSAILVLGGILVLKDEVPPLREMRLEVFHDRSRQANSHIRPAHSRILRAIKLVVLPVTDVLKVHDSAIIKVLAWPLDLANVTWVYVGNRMLVRIPSPITAVVRQHYAHRAIETKFLQIQSAHKCNMAINETEFLVVRPVHGQTVVDAIEG